MTNADRCKRLRFRNAVLDARLAIGSYFTATVIQEIYENIGQSLSFVRLQLFLWGANNDLPDAAVATTTGLVAQSIRDMRRLCHLLSLNAIEQSEAALLTVGINETVKSLHLSNEPVRFQGRLEKVGVGLQALLLRTVQELLLVLAAQHRCYVATEVRVFRTRVVIGLFYEGRSLAPADFDRTRHTTGHGFGLFDRLKLLDASWQFITFENHTACIQLEVSLNLNLYEENDTNCPRR